MKVGAMLRETVAASAVLAAVVAIAGSLAGHATPSLGIGLGLLLGSGNGYLIAALVERRAPFVAASILRMAILSSLALVTALILGSSAWSVLLGVGVAQMVMVAAGIRQGLRA